MYLIVCTRPGLPDVIVLIIFFPILHFLFKPIWLCQVICFSVLVHHSPKRGKCLKWVIQRCCGHTMGIRDCLGVDCFWRAFWRHCGFVGIFFHRAGTSNRGHAQKKCYNLFCLNCHRKKLSTILSRVFLVPRIASGLAQWFSYLFTSYGGKKEKDKHVLQKDPQIVNFFGGWVNWTTSSPRQSSNCFTYFFVRSSNTHRQF